MVRGVRFGLGGPRGRVKGLEFRLTGFITMT